MWMQSNCHKGLLLLCGGVEGSECDGKNYEGSGHWQLSWCRTPQQHDVWIIKPWMLWLPRLPSSATGWWCTRCTGGAASPPACLSSWVTIEWKLPRSGHKPLSLTGRHCGRSEWWVLVQWARWPCLKHWCSVGGVLWKGSLVYLDMLQPLKLESVANLHWEQKSAACARRHIYGMQSVEMESWQTVWDSCPVFGQEQVVS